MRIQPTAVVRLRAATTSKRAQLTNRLIVAGLLAWAATDVPWWFRPPGHSAPTPVVLGFILLMLTAALPFLWWRRSPLLAAALAAAVLVVRWRLGVNLFAAGAATLVGAYGLGAWGDRRLRRAARILGVVAAVGAGVVLATSHGFRNEALPLALLATALGLGEVTAANRDAATASAHAAYDKERARIARELHDVLSHQLSAIAIQAGAARIASRADPGVATKVVGNIEAIAREGLIDLNRIVGALRRDADEQLDRRPQPRLGDLPDLLTGARDAGLPVDLDMSGLPATLPAPVELAAYRVVQESLTNALRYAQAPTRVRLTCAEGTLDVLVEDDGPGSPVAVGAFMAAMAGPGISTPTRGASGRSLTGRGAGGRGLAGLAERAQILGGRLEAGPRPGGGFAVHAWLPVHQ